MNSGEPVYFHKECGDKPINGKELQGIVHRQSDYSIVSKKSRNGDGEKGVAEIRGDARETTSRHRTGQTLTTKLTSLTTRAVGNPKGRFNALMHLFTEDYLKECFWALKRNKAPGVDGETVESYEENLESNLKGLVARMKAWQYKPQPARRVYIPKDEHTKRGLGIPAVEDKIVEIGITRILEAIFEVDFMDVSFGFRPKRSCHQALDVLDKAIMLKPVNSVVDMDIRKYFDTIDHDWLMKCLRQRINDSNLLRLIGRCLNAGIMEEGRYIKTDKGTPQGSPLSPMLSNIYLHFVLDLWFEKKYKKQVKGYAQLIRYADDFVVLFCSNKEAEVFGEKLKERLNKFGLEIAEDKSRIIEFGREVWKKAQRERKQIDTFDFLGFTHYCDKTIRGGFKLGRKTSRAKFVRKMKETNQWLKTIRNRVTLKEWWHTLRQKIAGHYRYYGISGNGRAMWKFLWRTQNLAYKWINRRSHKKSFNFAQFALFEKYNPLPKPKIYHRIYMSSC